MSTAVFVILLCFALLASVLIGSWVPDFHKSDAAGQGLTQGFSVVLDIALLLDIAALLLVTGSRGGFAALWGIVATLIFVAGAIAQFNLLIGLTKLEAGVRNESILQILVPAAPLLLIAFAALHFFTRPPAAAAAAIAAASLAVAGVSFAFLAPAKAESQARVDERTRLWQQERDRQQALIEKIKALPDDAPIADLIPYIYVPARQESDSRQAALNRIRSHPDRQAEIEAALASGDARVFRWLADLNVAVTPELCKAARSCARAYFTGLGPTEPQQHFADAEPVFEPLTAHLRWLLEGGCDCRPEAALLQQSVEKFPDGFERRLYLNELQTLQQRAP